MYDSQQRVENWGFSGNTQRNRCLYLTFWHYEGNQAMKIRNDKGNRRDLNRQLFLLFGLLFCWISHLLWWRLGCWTDWHQILSSVLKASTLRLQMMLPSFNMFPCPLGNLFFFFPLITPYNQKTPNSHPVRGEEGLDHTSSTPPFKPATQGTDAKSPGLYLVPLSLLLWLFTKAYSGRMEESSFAVYILYLQIIWSLNVLFSGYTEDVGFCCFSWWYPYFCVFWIGSWPYLLRHCSNQSMLQEQKMIK